MKKILVIGGAGFVGSHTVDELIERGFTVSVLDLKSWDEAVNLHHHKKGVITYIQGDIRDFEFLEKNFAGHTHVLHLAALVSVPESISNPLEFNNTNITGTLNVFEAARRNNISKVVYASSAAVYGNQSSVPVAESAQTKSESPYGLHKIVNDEYAHLYGQNFNLSITGLRYFNIFGPRQNPSSPYSGVVSIFVDKIQKGEPITIYGDGKQTRDFVYVDNVVQANLLALGSDKRGVYNVGIGQETSLLTLVSTIEEVVGKKTQIDFKNKREGDIERSYASIEKIKLELGYIPEVDLKNGLKKLYDN